MNNRLEESFVEDWLMKSGSNFLFPKLGFQPLQEKEVVNFNEQHSFEEKMLRMLDEFSNEIKVYNASLDAKFESSHKLDVPIVTPCDEVEGIEILEMSCEFEKCLVEDLLVKSDSNLTLFTLIPQPP